MRALAIAAALASSASATAPCGGIVNCWMDDSVVVEPCVAAAANQSWTFEPGAAGRGRLRSALPSERGLCAVVNGSSPDVPSAKAVREQSTLPHPSLPTPPHPTHSRLPGPPAAPCQATPLSLSLFCR